MAIYFHEKLFNKSKPISNDDRLKMNLVARNDMLKVLKNIQKSKYIESTLNDNEWYSNNRIFINRHFINVYDGHDKGKIYADEGVRDFINILEKVKDGDPDIIKNMISNNKSTSDINFISDDGSCVYIASLINFTGYKKMSDSERELAIDGIDSLKSDLRSVVDIMVSKIDTGVIDIKVVDIDSYFRIEIRTNNKRLKKLLK